MPNILRSTAFALGPSLLAGGAPAADQMDCCGKSKDSKMACYDKMTDKTGRNAEGQPRSKAPAADPHQGHQH